MKNIILTIVGVALLFSTVAFAEVNPNTHGLSDEQKATLVLQIEKMKRDSADAALPIPVIKPDTVKKYAEIATIISSVLTTTAKELGVTVNDFIKTPVGILTAGVIVWQYVGNDILGIIIGGMWMLLGTIFWLYIYRRAAILDTVEYYHKEAREDGKKKVIPYTETNDISGEYKTFLWGMFIVIQGIGLLIIL